MLDLLIKGGKVVMPGRGVIEADIGVTHGKISCISSDLDGAAANRTIDAKRRLVFPGVVDSHFHVGIYRPLAEDAKSESRSAAAGGVTTILSYFRAGRNYLNSSEPYGTLYRRVLSLSRGNFFTDYSYNLAPITRTHVREIPALVEEHGVSTFKFFMFYRGLSLKGAYNKGAVEREYLLSEDPYDLGHLLKIMDAVAALKNRVRGVRLSIHAEDAEIIRVNMENVKKRNPGRPSNPLDAYSKARPSESERLAIIQAVELASQTGCPINILHVGSKMALETIQDLKATYRDLDLMTETTVHHLVLTVDSEVGVRGKVNPPIRAASDREAIWRGIINGAIDTVVSDHACVTAKDKGDELWSAEPGFGGSELLLPFLISEGHVKRGVPLEKIAALLCLNPARFHALEGKKGDIRVGADADLAIYNLSGRHIVDHTQLHSAQDFSPFDGLEVTGAVETTILRGDVVYDHGKFAKKPTGEYIKRPATKSRRTA